MGALIIRGEDATIHYDLTDEAGAQFPLIGITGVSGNFQNDDDSWILVAGSVESIDCGKVVINLNETQTALLKIGTGQKLQLTMDFGSVRRKAQFDDALDVVDDITGNG